jgi:hypothetical protein
MSTQMSTAKILFFVLYGIALAMGVAVIVLPLVGQTVDISLVGIALFCLGLAGLNTVSGKP